MGSVFRCLQSEDASESKAPAKKEKENSRITDQDRAILDLKRRVRDVKTYIVKLETKCSENKKLALKYKKTERNKAIMALKLKKMFDKEIEKANGMQFTLEKAVNDIEEAKLNVNVYEVLKEGDAVLQNISNKVSLADLEEIYENQQEREQAQEEISDFMKENVIQEEEFDAELEALDDILAGLGEKKEARGMDEVEAQREIDKLEDDDLSAPQHQIETSPHKQNRSHNKQERVLLNA